MIKAKLGNQVKAFSNLENSPSLDERYGKEKGTSAMVFSGNGKQY